MCGICGVVDADRQRRPPREQLAAMTYRLRFRGPDAEGFYIGPGVGLGHRRLGVLDLTGGVQPMSDPSGQVILCYNGEIYNFFELRRQLQSLGVVFRTTGDTEVLLHGYLRWGADVVDRLAGMFVFAVWDSRDESLVLARDRLGVKPLYWAPLANGGLIFASELSALTAGEDGRRSLNLQAVAHYLSSGYLPGDDVILDGIHRLAPGTTLTWRRGQPASTRRYWDLAAVWAGRAPDMRSDAEIEEEFAALLETAVRQRLLSDVPLGVFLSGGLDSSTITALMRRLSSRVETFSIGFREASYDELPWARRVARELGSTHYEEVVRGDDPALLVEIASRLDEPFADTSLIPTYTLCRMARRRVTVALSGDGGDELLAGYVTHRATRLQRWVRHLPRPLVRALNWTVNCLPENGRKVNAVFKAKQFLAGAKLSPCEAHAWWRTLAPPALVERLLHHDPRVRGYDPFEPFRRAYREGRGLGRLDRFLYVDYRTWLVGDILIKADRASMAHGLEVRSPFLDHRLVEFCAGLPRRLKLSGRCDKVLLRRFAHGLVPRAVLHRRKAGFNSPVSHWMAGPWRELTRDTLSPAHLRSGGVLDPAVVTPLLEDHQSGRRDHGYLLFALLMFSLWLQSAGT
jgi:asparagine synthase (glutamine-hydrolysing)